MCTGCDDVIIWRDINVRDELLPVSRDRGNVAPEAGENSRQWRRRLADSRRHRGQLLVITWRQVNIGSTHSLRLFYHMPFMVFSTNFMTLISVVEAYTPLDHCRTTCKVVRQSIELAYHFLRCNLSTCIYQRWAKLKNKAFSWYF